MNTLFSILRFVAKVCLPGLLILVANILCSCEPDKQKRGTQEDEDVPQYEIEGEWSGVEIGTGLTWQMDIHISQLSYATSEEEIYSGRIVEVDTTSNVRKVRVRVTDSDFAPYIGTTSYAIYRFLSEDVVVLAGNEPGTEYYPADFTGRDNSRVLLLSRNGAGLPEIDSIPYITVPEPPEEPDTIPPGGGSGISELQGYWRGTEVGDTVVWEMLFRGNEFGNAWGGSEYYMGTYAVDYSRTVRRLNGFITETSISDYTGEQLHAIYQLTSDTTLIMAANEPGVAAYPNNFMVGQGARIFNMLKISEVLPE